MERIQMAAYAGLRPGLVGGSQGGEAAAGGVKDKGEVVCFDLAAGGRVPGVLYGSGPPDAPGCLLVAKRRAGRGTGLARGLGCLVGCLPSCGSSSCEEVQAV